ncbi:hypothetical protein VTO73DRAFT_12794 [Trametes versicolor]
MSQLPLKLRVPTVISSEVFLLVLALHPQIQARAQEEIDGVVDILRWYPPAPTGIPHLLKEDDMYRGYHIPKESIVVGNIWGITHDSASYPDPMNDPSRYAFGFGRRVCPGKLLAEDSTWPTVAQFLAVMTLTVPAGDAPPKVEFVSGPMSRPMSFKCEIRPRSDAAAQLIECCVRE